MTQPGTRSFNALTGSELRTIILKEVTQELSLDPQLKGAGATTSLGILWRLRVESYPNVPPNFTVQVTQQVKRPADNPLAVAACAGLIYKLIEQALLTDERFLTHLTYPKVTWDWNLSLEVQRVGGVVHEKTVEPSPVRKVGKLGAEIYDIAAATRTQAPPPSREDYALHADLAAAPDRAVVSELEKERAERIRLENLLNAMSQRMQETEHGQTPPKVVVDPFTYREVVIPELPGTVMSAAETKAHDIPNYTGTGLPIDAAFKASPGAGLAGSYGGGSVAGQIPTADAVTQRFEIGTSHPPLEEGGAGAPDQLRRDANLPIPSMQATKTGMIVDLPGNVF